MAVGVLTAVHGPAEAMVVRAVERLDVGLAVTRRCADLAELLAAAEVGLGRVAVVSAGVDHLDREAVDLLHHGGVRVVGLADAALPWTAQRLVGCGVDVVLDTPVDQPGADAVARAAAAVLEGAVPAATPAGPGRWEPPEDVPRRRTGRLVAVWGPTGAPGRTTVAVNVAAELAAMGHETLLVDLDTYGGCVAPVLGLLDEAPGVAAAARAAAQGALDAALLARLAPVLVPGLRVLSGIARADRWPELPAAVLDVLWPQARALASWTVVDCGFGIEQDEALTYDTRAPQRNGATLAALGEADVVVVVGAGDPIGVQRLVRALGALADLRLDAERLVVVNRVRSSAVGPRPAESLRRALARYAGVDGAHLVPQDGLAVDTALLQGRTLREVAPGSPARRALAAVAAALVRLDSDDAAEPVSRRRLRARPG